MTRCRGGDTEAYGALVRRYEGRLASLVFHYVGPGGDVRDLVQESFIRAYMAIGRFGGRSSFSTWLYRITVNVCIDHLRKQARRPRAAAPLEGEDGPFEREVADERGESPRRAAARGELRDAIGRAVGLLPPGQRAAVVLHMVEGLPCEEVARVMGCAVGTVKAHLFKAREKLRTALVDYTGTVGRRA